MIAKRWSLTARAGLLSALASLLALAPARAAADPPPPDPEELCPEPNPADLPPPAAGALWGYHPMASESPELCGVDPPEECPSVADTAICPNPLPESPLCVRADCTNPDGSPCLCEPGTTCAGTKVPYEYGNPVCGTAGCCLSGSVGPDGVVDVLPYLQRPPGLSFSADPSVDASAVDDSPGIAAAIRCAASLSTPRRTVYFPAGRYVLRSPLRPHHDRLTLEGPALSPSAAPGDPGTATLVAIPCNPEQFPGAVQLTEFTIQHSTGPQTYAHDVSGVWIRNFQIELTEGPRKRANAGIHLNACRDCAVENIIMRYAPRIAQLPSCKPANLDGISFSWGSGGVIRNVIVDGVPKGGIYLSTVAGYHCTPPILVENCELKNINGPVGASALKIVTENVTVRNCDIHHNRINPPAGGWGNGGHGLSIATQPAPEAGIPGPVPAHVVVQDSYIHHNGGSGIVLASPVADHRPSDIEFERVKTAHNGEYGAYIQAGDDLRFYDLWSWSNGYYGMYLTSKATLPVSALRVGHVMVEDPLIFNNYLRTASSPQPGIRIEASDVEIHGGTIARCESSCGWQEESIEEAPWQVGPVGAKVTFFPERNCASGVETDGTSAPAVATCP